MGKVIKNLRKEGEKIIEVLRAEGEKTIKDIIDYINYDYKYDTKNVKNKVIKNILKTPRKFYGVTTDFSLGFIELDEENSVPVINENRLLISAKVEEVNFKYKEKNFKELKERLLNNIISFDDLDGLLEDNGYYSMLDYSEVKQNANKFKVVYKAAKGLHYDLEVTFVIGANVFKKILNGEFKEGELYVRITDIKKELKKSSGIKINVEKLRERLLNQEVNFVLLNRILDDNGYYSVFINQFIEDIKDNMKVIFTAEDTGKEEIEISFEITKNNGLHELEENFWLKVTDIKRI